MVCWDSHSLPVRLLQVLFCTGSIHWPHFEQDLTSPMNYYKQVNYAPKQRLSRQRLESRPALRKGAILGAQLSVKEHFWFAGVSPSRTSAQGTHFALPRCIQLRSETLRWLPPPGGSRALQLQERISGAEPGSSHRQEEPGAGAVCPGGSACSTGTEGLFCPHWITRFAPQVWPGVAATESSKAVPNILWGQRCPSLRGSLRFGAAVRASPRGMRLLSATATGKCPRGGHPQTQMYLRMWFGLHSTREMGNLQPDLFSLTSQADQPKLYKDILVKALKIIHTVCVFTISLKKDFSPVQTARAGLIL